MVSLADFIQKQLRIDEGYSATVYKDSLGYDTLGIGFLVDKRKGGGLRPEEIQFIFENRLRLITTELFAKAPWITKLDEPRQGALINMAFQLGVDGLLEFVHSLAFVQQGKWNEAGEAFAKSDWAKQTPNRAKRIITQIRTGVWQFI